MIDEDYSFHVHVWGSESPDMKFVCSRPKSKIWDGVEENLETNFGLTDFLDVSVGPSSRGRTESIFMAHLPTFVILDICKSIRTSRAFCDAKQVESIQSLFERVGVAFVKEFSAFRDARSEN